MRLAWLAVVRRCQLFFIMGGVGGVWRIYSFGIHSILQRLVEDYRIGITLSVVCTTTRYITVFHDILLCHLLWSPSELSLQPLSAAHLLGVNIICTSHNVPVTFASPGFVDWPCFESVSLRIVLSERVALAYGSLLESHWAPSPKAHVATSRIVRTHNEVRELHALICSGIKLGSLRMPHTSLKEQPTLPICYWTCNWILRLYVMMISAWNVRTAERHSNQLSTMLYPTILLYEGYCSVYWVFPCRWVAQRASPRIQ